MPLFSQRPFVLDSKEFGPAEQTREPGRAKHPFAKQVVAARFPLGPELDYSPAILNTLLKGQVFNFLPAEYI
jgi:hypothetical protein